MFEAKIESQVSDDKNDKNQKTDNNDYEYNGKISLK